MAAGVALLLIVIGGGIFARKSVLENQLEGLLLRHDLPSTVEVTKFSPTQLMLSVKSQLGDEDANINLQDFQVFWHVKGLGVHVDAVQIDYAKLPIAITESGIDFGALQGLLAILPQQKSDTAPTPPSIYIKALDITAVTEAGTVPITISAGHNAGRYWATGRGQAAALQNDTAKLVVRTLAGRVYGDQHGVDLRLSLNVPDIHLPDAMIKADDMAVNLRARSPAAIADILSHSSQPMQILTLPWKVDGHMAADMAHYQGAELADAQLDLDYNRNAVDDAAKLAGGGRVDLDTRVILPKSIQNQITGMLPDALTMHYRTGVRRVAQGFRLQADANIQAENNTFKVALNNPVRLQPSRGGIVTITGAQPIVYDPTQRSVAFSGLGNIAVGGLPSLNLKATDLTYALDTGAVSAGRYTLRYSGRYQDWRLNNLLLSGRDFGLDMQPNMSMSITSCANLQLGQLSNPTQKIDKIKGMLCPQGRRPMFSAKANGWSSSLGIKNMGLSLPEFDLDVAGLDARLTIAGNDRGLTKASVPITRMSITDRQPTKRFGQIGIKGDVNYAPGAWGGDVQLYDNYGDIGPISFTQQDSGSGHADITLANLTFAPAARTLGAVAPAFAGVAKGLTGQITGQAKINWQPEQMRGHGTFATESLDVIVGDALVVKGMSGQLEMQDLFTLRSAPDQTLIIPALEAGVPLNFVNLTYQIEPDAVVISALEAPFAGGILGIEPTRFQLDGQNTSGVITLSGVTADGVIDLLDAKDKLKATGTFDARLPYTISAADMQVEEGTFTAREPGTISFDAPSASGPANLAMQALKDFSYNDLSGTMSGDPTGQMKFKMTFVGKANSTVNLENALPGGRTAAITGAPFKFNLTTELDLAKLMQGAAASANAAEEFKKRAQ